MTTSATTFNRPAGHHRIQAALGADGSLVAWRQHLVNTSRYEFAKNGQPPANSELYPEDFPAGSVPNARLEYTSIPCAIPTGAWRSTLHSANAFAVESFIDELAQAAHHDPVDFRLGLLGAPRQLPYSKHGGPVFDTGRLAAVIRLAAKNAGWPKPATAGRALGIAAHFTFGSYAAEVAEVSLEHGAIKVHRVIAAIDCGTVVNPSGAEAQVQGGIIDGLSAALYGEITVADGEPAQRGFGDYRLLRMGEAPVISVQFVANTEPPRGLGEPPVPPIGPAVANALFTLTGHRIRRLPLQQNFERVTVK